MPVLGRVRVRNDRIGTFTDQSLELFPLDRAVSSSTVRLAMPRMPFASSTAPTSWVPSSRSRPTCVPFSHTLSRKAHSSLTRSINLCFSLSLCRARRLLVVVTAAAPPTTATRAARPATRTTTASATAARGRRRRAARVAPSAVARRLRTVSVSATPSATPRASASAAAAAAVAVRPVATKKWRVARGGLKVWLIKSFSVGLEKALASHLEISRIVTGCSVVLLLQNETKIPS